jgi:uncharacterized membrane protein YdbT with pleckstrin-like domain
MAVRSIFNQVSTLQTNLVSGSDEAMVWQGRSNQIVNFSNFLIYGVVAMGFVWAAFNFNKHIAWGALVCALKIAYDWYFTQSTQYVLTTQRFIRRSGVLNKSTFEIELYRVKEALLFEPLWLRIFSLGNIRLSSSQRSSHIFLIQAIDNPTQLRETIRKLVEKRRTEKGVGEFDTPNSNY